MRYSCIPSVSAKARKCKEKYARFAIEERSVAFCTSGYLMTISVYRINKLKKKKKRDDIVKNDR